MPNTTSLGKAFGYLVSLAVAVGFVASCASGQLVDGTSPRAVGTRFLQSAISGDVQGAYSMLPLDQRLPITLDQIRRSATALRGCDHSRQEFLERDGPSGTKILTVVLTPACGSAGPLNNGAAGSLTTCQIVLSQVNDEWKPTGGYLWCW